MSRIKELLEHDKDEELWQLCCGFIDLNLEQIELRKNNESNSLREANRVCS